VAVMAVSEVCRLLLVTQLVLALYTSTCLAALWWKVSPLGKSGPSSYLLMETWRRWTILQ